MKKLFRDLRIGDKFYPTIKGQMNLNSRYIKVSEIALPVSGEPSCLVTTSAFKHTRFNCVIVESPNNLNGYFHFAHDDDLVFPEGPTI